MRHTYTIKELNFLRKHYPTKGAKWCAEQLGLSRTNLIQYAVKQGIKYEGPQLGVYQKGSEPWNKGMKYSPPGSEATRFKPGQLPHNARQEGEVYLRDDHGTKYYFIKLKGKRPQPYHRHLWEQQNGPISKGCVVVFVDGDQMNCVIENLSCISRAENCKRPKYRKDIDRTAAGKKAWKTRDINMRQRLGLPVHQ